MNRFARLARPPSSRSLFRVERLESRYVLSLSVLGTDPMPGARLATPPTALIVTFDRPIDPITLSNSDILLGRATDDEGLNWIDDAVQAPGPADNQLVLTPGQGLAPGHYRIVLAGDSGLLGTDGEGLGGDGTDRVLGDFWVTARGVGLGDAIDLGTPGPDPTATPGVLDFQADPNDVKLYKITLPTGHFWRLGVEVSAQRDGGSLDSALALFDAEGRPIASSELGRKDAPFDPYLFAGLGAGTYYIGVSGTRNLPGVPGSYDPATETPGSVVQPRPGGPFTLHVVADPADAPISLLDFDVDRADPLDPTPTGLTIGFSGAIRLDGESGDLSGDLSGGIEVVDQSGRAWPVAATGYSESEARVSFLFRNRLPEGRYTVRLARQGGLVDLAGLSPVAPGRPAGVLGTFSVGPSEAPEDPRDLGALLPDAALAGIAADAPINPGESVTYRVVITFPGTYTLQGRFDGGPLEIRIGGPEGTFTVGPVLPEVVETTSVSILVPGVYTIRLEATGSGPVLAHLTLKIPSFSQEWVIANGVGQGPALSLRLVAPPPVSPPPTPIPDPPPPRPGPSPGDTAPPGPPPSPPTPEPEPPPPPPPRPGPSPGDTAPPGPGRPPADGAGGVPESPASADPRQIPPSLILGLGGDLVGRPTPDVRPVATVNTESHVVLIASASDRSRPPQGTGFGTGSRGGRSPNGPAPGADGAAAEPDVESTEADSASGDRDQEGPPRLADEWTIRLIPTSAIAGRSEAWPPDDLGAEIVSPMQADAGPGPDEAEPDPPQVERCGIASSAPIAVAAALVARFLHRISRRPVRDRAPGSPREWGPIVRAEPSAKSDRNG